MCSRVDQNKQVHKFVQQFPSKAQTGFPGFNIGIGDTATIVSYADNTPVSDVAIFGFVPHWAKEVKQLFYNARTEGKFNEENSGNYTGPLGIFQMPAFKDAIVSSRCVVPVSAFYEGPEKEGLANPYRIYSPLHEVILLAGIWTTHFNPKKNESVQRFSILTSAANDVTASIGHHRCPLMLSEQSITDWLNPKTDLSVIEKLMYLKWKPEDLQTLAVKPEALKQRLRTTLPEERGMGELF